MFEEGFNQRKQRNNWEGGLNINMEQPVIDQPGIDEIKEFESFLQYERFLTPLTTHSYIRNIYCFSAFLKSDLFSTVSLLNVKKEDLGRFLTHLRQKNTPISSNTLTHYIVALRTFYAWAAYRFKRSDLIEINFYLKNIIKTKTEHKIPFIPKKEDIEKLRRTLKAYKELNSHDRNSYTYKKIIMAYAIFELLLTTGMRSNELRTFCLKDIDFENKTIFIRFGKGGRQRVSLFGGTAFEVLSEYVLLNNFNPDDKIFPIRYGNVLHYMIKRWAKKANIDSKIHIHSLRHYHVTESQRQGIGLPFVAAQVGHTNWNSTKVYSHYSVDFIKEQYEGKNI